jgi:hypothetical protein
MTTASMDKAGLDSEVLHGILLRFGVRKPTDLTKVEDVALKTEVTIEETVRKEALEKLRKAMPHFTAAMENRSPVAEESATTAENQGPPTGVEIPTLNDVHDDVHPPEELSGSNPSRDGKVPETPKTSPEDIINDFVFKDGGQGGGGGDGNGGGNGGGNSFDPEPEPMRKYSTNSTTKGSKMEKVNAKVVVAGLIILAAILMVYAALNKSPQSIPTVQQNQATAETRSGMVSNANATETTAGPSMGNSGGKGFGAAYPFAKEGVVYSDDEGNTYERHTGGWRVCEFAINGKILQRIFVGDLRKPHDIYATKKECDIEAKKFYSRHKPTTVH